MHGGPSVVGDKRVTKDWKRGKERAREREYPWMPLGYVCALQSSAAVCSMLIEMHGMPVCLRAYTPHIARRSIARKLPLSAKRAK